MSWGSIVAAAVEQRASVAGDDLVAEYENRLAGLGITTEQAEEYGFRLLTREATKEELGYCKGIGSIAIPYHTADGVPTGFCRYRFMGYTGPAKYVQNLSGDKLAASGCAVYFQPGHNWLECMRNAAEPLIITEGEFKAIAANQLKHTNCLALGGVYSFSTELTRVAGSVLLPELGGFAMRGREVYIAFDYDGTQGAGSVAGEPKEEVKRAEMLLASNLLARGASVYFVRLWNKEKPSEKVGLDDYIASGRDITEALQAAKARGGADVLEGPMFRMLAEWYEYKGKAINVQSGELLAFSELRNKYSNIFVGDFNVFDKWKQSKWRGSVAGVDFIPEQNTLLVAGEGGLLVNTWRGWWGQVGGDGKASIEPWLDFKRAFFSGDPHLEEHFDLWFACLIQKPWMKQFRLPIAKSHVEGVGKSFLFETVAWAMVGGSTGLFRKFAAAKVLGPNDLADQWTDWAEGTVYAVFNEPGEMGSKHNNLLKDLVTGESLRVNNKYGLKYTLRNYVNFAITTNMDYTHRFSSTSRREMVVEPPPEMREYPWREMVQWRGNGGLEALMAYYTEYDLGEYTGREPAPSSTAKEEMYLAGLVGWDAYLQELVADGVEYLSYRVEYERALEAGCRGSKQMFGVVLRRYGYSVKPVHKGQLDLRKYGWGKEIVYGRKRDWFENVATDVLAMYLTERYGSGQHGLSGGKL